MPGAEPRRLARTEDNGGRIDGSNRPVDSV